MDQFNALYVIQWNLPFQLKRYFISELSFVWFSSSNRNSFHSSLFRRFRRCLPIHKRNMCSNRKISVSFRMENLIAERLCGVRCWQGNHRNLHQVAGCVWIQHLSERYWEFPMNEGRPKLTISFTIVDFYWMWKIHKNPKRKKEKKNEEKMQSLKGQQINQNACPRSIISHSTLSLVLTFSPFPFRCLHDSICFVFSVRSCCRFLV